MIKLTNRIKTMLAGLLLLIFSAYYVNSTMCYHQHVISGETIFHSHFSLNGHSNIPDGDGDHTLEAAKLIAVLNQIAVEEQSFENSISTVTPLLKRVIEVCDTPSIILYIEYGIDSRGPPTV